MSTKGAVSRDRFSMGRGLRHRLLLTAWLREAETMPVNPRTEGGRKGDPVPNSEVMGRGRCGIVQVKHREGCGPGPGPRGLHGFSHERGIRCHDPLKRELQSQDTQQASRRVP